MNLSLTRIIIIETLVGGIFGYLIIHPILILIDNYFIHHDLSVLQSILIAFSGMHFKTAIILITIGLITGFLLGLLSYRQNFFSEKNRLLSITDELTQTNNRRYFINELEKEIERSKRFSRNLSLIILDIDKFKYYNDIYGHIVGDKVIKSVARSLTETIRKIDFVARYGGDEFVIVMPETEKSMANILAERLQKKFSQDFFEDNEIQIKISVSFGIAGFPNDAKNIDELISDADLALYKAKEEGGNKICNFNIKLKKNQNN